MKKQWRIPDFIDLEYFFFLDSKLAEEEGEEVLRDRDRAMYLEEFGSDAEVTESDRENLLYRWLQRRRERENSARNGQAPLPGRMWYELYGLFWAFCSFFALFSGTGIAYSFLAYSGKQPVNVSSFFLFFVIFQFGILAVLLLIWGYRRACGFDLGSSLLLSFVSRGLNSFLFKIRRFSFEGMDEGRKAAFAASLAAVHNRANGYGTLFLWPLFLLFQLFGIAFNCGVLGAVLVKVATSDLAFGWQSTIQLSTRFVSDLVEWIALPWSWLLGAFSYPDMYQIEGSRMILKDGFYHLVSTDLVSWWPFLCLSVFCYCLVPRMLLFVAGILGRSRALSKVSLRRVEHNQLLHRLLSPRLKTGIQENTIKRERAENVVEPEHRVKAHSIHGSLLALVPEELFADCDQSELEKFSRQAFGYNVADVLSFHSGDVKDQIFQHLKHDEEISCPPLLILQEAWQAPIQETLSFLSRLRKQCDEETHIIIALIGKPQKDTLFTIVTDMDLRIWKEKLASLKDRSLQVSQLRNT